MLRELNVEDRFIDDILSGKKRAITRRVVCGFPGDVFQVGGMDYRIVSLWYWPLERIRDMLYPLEGFSSSRAFEDYYVHKGYKLNAETGCYVHIFDNDLNNGGFGYYPGFERNFLGAMDGE